MENRLFQIKIINHHIFVEIMPFVMVRSKSKQGASVPKESLYVTEVQWDISDLPLVENLNYIYINI